MKLKEIVSKAVTLDSLIAMCLIGIMACLVYTTCSSCAPATTQIKDTADAGVFEEPKDPPLPLPKLRSDKFACPTFPADYNYLSQEALEQAYKDTKFDPEVVAPPIESIMVDGHDVPNLPFDRATNCFRMDYVSKRSITWEKSDLYKINWLFNKCIDWSYSFVIRITMTTGEWKEILLVTRPTRCGFYAISPIKLLGHGNNSADPTNSPTTL